MPINEFAKHVAELHADGDIGFSKEYEAIQNESINEEFPSEHSQHPDNKQKNRYLNIIACKYADSLSLGGTYPMEFNPFHFVASQMITRGSICGRWVDRRSVSITSMQISSMATRRHEHLSVHRDRCPVHLIAFGV